MKSSSIPVFRRKETILTCYNLRMDYYSQEFFIPQVNEQDEIIGRVERWKAHREGILHRGYTIGLFYEGQMVCQHRKHPVFDGFLDLTASSHQIYQGDDLMDMNTSLFWCLEREWNLKKEDITTDFKLAGKVVYESKHGEYIEHEVCHLYLAQTKTLPVFNPEYAYGISLIPVDQLNNPSTNAVLSGLAPWVTPMIEQKIIDLALVS